MKAGRGDRIRMRLMPRWAKFTERAAGRAMERREQSGLRESEVIEEIASEFTTEELQEFLEADQSPIEADPLFKEQLREKLWKLLQRSIRSESDDA
jgi:hypothetical protein